MDLCIVCLWTYVAQLELKACPSTTPLVERINELESKTLDGKLVLAVGDDGKPLKPWKSTLHSSKMVVDLDNTDCDDDEVLNVYNELLLI